MGEIWKKHHDVTFGSNSGPSYDLAHGQVEAGIEQAAPSSFGPSEKKVTAGKVYFDLFMFAITCFVSARIVSLLKSFNL